MDKLSVVLGKEYKFRFVHFKNNCAKYKCINKFCTSTVLLFEWKITKSFSHTSKCRKRTEKLKKDCPGRIAYTKDTLEKKENEDKEGLNKSQETITSIEEIEEKKWWEFFYLPFEEILSKVGDWIKMREIILI